MRKHKGKKRNVSFFLAILISAVFFTLISIIGKLTIYQAYDINLWKTPMLSVMFEAVKDGVYPWDMIREDTWRKPKITDSEYVIAGGIPEQIETEYDAHSNQSMTDSPGTKPTSPDETGEGEEESKPSSPDESGEGKEESKPTRPDQSGDGEEETKPSSPDETGDGEEKSKPTSPDQSGDSQVGKENPEDKDSSKKEDSSQADEQSSEVTKSLGEVEQAYFDDVLFIGDSRTVGLSEYSYLDNATYYSDVGLSVYTVFDKKIAKIGSKSVTLEQALKKKQFQKIYIMLGINELGTGTTKTFVAKYEEMLSKVQKLQPDAYIVIQAIMNLGKEVSDTDNIFNNKNIAERNQGLKTLADNKRIFYIDVNEVLTDKKGYLPEDTTFDGIHLKAKYYNEWADFLMKNGIEQE